MTSLTGSPSKGKNPFIDRYMASLGSNATTTPIPVTTSPIKTGLEGANKSVRKWEFSSSYRDDDKDKENGVSHKSGHANSPKPSNRSSPLKALSPARQNSCTPARNVSVKREPLSLKPRGANQISETFDVKKLSSKDLKYYEFLCRVREAKEWIEAVISEDLPSELELVCGNSMRNGVFLAKVTQRIDPSLVKKIVPAGTTLQFTHTQNINAFFHLVEKVGVPDLFRFELTDLYEKKNIPKVFETLHALINVINSKWTGKVPEIQNLSGIVSFTGDDLKLCQRKIPTVHNFRSFKFSSAASTELSASQEHVMPGLLHNHNEDVTTENTTQIQESPKTQIQESPKTPTKMPATSSINERNSQMSPVLVDSSKYSATNILTETAPLLSFDHSTSPAKSLSYYSPRIYRHLSYRSDPTDFYSSRLTDPYEFDQYDTLKYNTPEYSPVRRKRMTEFQFLDSVCNLQAVCRGVNTRFGVTILQRKVDIVIEKITAFQGHTRAYMARKETKNKSAIVTSQEPHLRGLQSLIKGDITRTNIFKLRVRLLNVEDQLIFLQSICRAKVIKRRCQKTLESHLVISQPLKNIQATVKGVLRRKSDTYMQNLLLTCLPAIINFQGLLRSHHLRKHRKSIYFSLNEQYNKVVAIQALSKSLLQRQSIRRLRRELEGHKEAVSNIAALLRGSTQRGGIKSLATAVRDSRDPVVSLQALSRGVLVRFTLDLIADIVEASELVKIQTFAKGYLIRKHNNQLTHHYVQRVSDVVKVQACIRRHQLRKAYLEFMSAANPSIWAVRRFVHLLNKIHTNHESCSKLEWLKSQIDHSNKSRDKVQEGLELLQRKSLILSDYNIFVGSINSSGDELQFNGSSCFRGYEKLIYLLQTDSFYWKTLYRLDKNFAAKHLTKTFASANGSMGQRENAFFIRVVADFLTLDIESFDSVQQFLNEEVQSFWKDLMFFYVHRQLPELVIELFAPLLEFISTESVDFESVPAIIYKKLHPYEMERSSSESIEDEDTKSVFVNNLTNLWKAVEMVSGALLRNLHRVPEDIKFLCTTAYRVIADHSPYDSDALLAISKILLETLVFPFLKAPSKFGLQKLSTEAERKVCILSDVVETVFSFSKFQGYLTPLNQYAEQIDDDLALSLRKMLTSPSFENYCNRLIYIDMCQNERAALSISKQYLLEISNKLDSNMDAFPHDDPITGLLESIKVNEKKTLQRSTNSIIELRLNPSAYQLSSSDDRLTSIYNEIKRGLIYMMQVEGVDTNLYDLMTSSIIGSDEPTFQRLIHKTDAIKNDPLLKNLKVLSYFSLKQHVLERAYELKQMDNLGIEDNLQSVLNDIANTIKSREYVVESTASEIRTAEHTFKAIQAANSKLQQYSRSLEASQKRALKSAQTSSNYTPAKKHGIGHKLKDVYKKVNHKSVAPKNCLSIEWTTRHLYELGVLKDLAGENLGKVALSFFGSSGPKFPDLTFKFTTSDGEVFAVEQNDERKSDKLSSKSGTDSFELSKLLDLLAKNKSSNYTLFSKKADFNLAKLVELIICSFIKKPQPS
ncbi:LANO_0E02872g1_1 [Lachancea nothofagi CBS 11611]|uniref:LANO_0E02872g1_1 n=1 Tax=Lachancea nothofagi CBS 11611 TaxID=1266666 RepID=A0A1G4JQW8_9SACH|nr:LANO_0E02872g1_1 [Lachancea nothofagi CBS 11611]